MAADTRADPVPGLLGGSGRWLRRAAGAALRIPGRREGSFPVRVTMGKVCFHGNRNQEKMGWDGRQLYKEVWRRGKEQMLNIPMKQFNNFSLGDRRQKW